MVFGFRSCRVLQQRWTKGATRTSSAWTRAPPFPSSPLLLHRDQQNHTVTCSSYYLHVYFRVWENVQIRTITELHLTVFRTKLVCCELTCIIDTLESSSNCDFCMYLQISPLFSFIYCPVQRPLRSIISVLQEHFATGIVRPLTQHDSSFLSCNTSFITLKLSTSNESGVADISMIKPMWL